MDEMSVRQTSISMADRHLSWAKMDIRSKISLKGEESLVDGGPQSGESVRVVTQSRAMPLTQTVGERPERPDRRLGSETGSKQTAWAQAIHAVDGEKVLKWGGPAINQMLAV